MKRRSAPLSLLAFMLCITIFLRASISNPPRQMEHLGRGIVAIHQAGGRVFVGWRLLGTDPDGVTFDLYRTTGDAKPVKLNDKPLTGPTDFIDEKPDLTAANAYF